MTFTCRQAGSVAHHVLASALGASLASWTVALAAPPAGGTRARVMKGANVVRFDDTAHGGKFSKAAIDYHAEARAPGNHRNPPRVIPATLEAVTAELAR